MGRTARTSLQWESRLLYISWGLFTALPCPHTPPPPTQGQNSGSTPCPYLSKTHPVMMAMTMMMTRRKKDNKKKMLNDNKCIFFKMLFFLDHNSQSNKNNSLLCRYSSKLSPLGATSTWMEPEASLAIPTPERVSKTACLCPSLPYFKRLHLGLCCFPGPCHLPTF